VHYDNLPVSGELNVHFYHASSLAYCPAEALDRILWAITTGATVTDNPRRTGQT